MDESIDARRALMEKMKNIKMNINNKMDCTDANNSTNGSIMKERVLNRQDGNSTQIRKEVKLKVPKKNKCQESINKIQIDVMKFLLERHLDKEFEFLSVQQMSCQMRTDYSDEILNQLSKFLKNNIKVASEIQDTDGNQIEKFKFKPLVQFKNKEQLLAEMKKRFEKGDEKLHECDLCEAYRKANKAVTKLIKEKKLTALYKKSDNKTIVYYSPPSLYGDYELPEIFKSFLVNLDAPKTEVMLEKQCLEFGFKLNAEKKVPLKSIKEQKAETKRLERVKKNKTKMMKSKGSNKHIEGFYDN